MIKNKKRNKIIEELQIRERKALEEFRKAQYYYIKTHYGFGCGFYDAICENYHEIDDELSALQDKWILLNNQLENFGVSPIRTAKSYYYSEKSDNWIKGKWE